jgi:hypothetical protein
MIGRPTTSVLPVLLRRAAFATPRKRVERLCPACSRPVRDREHAVPIHGADYHAGCALYARRPSAS